MSVRPVLEARGIGVAFAAAMPIFEDATFVLEPGFHGLVGANGAGKTTLLRVLAGALAPSEGRVLLRPSGALVVTCEQELVTPSPDVLRLAAADDHGAVETRGRLALSPGALERWPTLSPGERKRWQIGAALAREPDVLLLDEPTNHLDADARRRLLAALGRFRGIGVVVSHDRALLELLPRAILRVHGARVTHHAGSYSAARAQWDEERAGREGAHARAKAAVRAVERRLDATRRTHEAAERSTHTRARLKGPRDHDGRSMGAKVVAGWAEARAGRAVATTRAELDRARAAVPVIERDRTLGGKVFAAYERAPHPILFHLDAKVVCARASDHVVLRDVRLDIGREERVRIAGPNGAGKTTLLEALLVAGGGGRGTRGARVLHLPQELERAESAQHLQRLRECSADERGCVLSVFAALGSDPERVVGRHDGLSPGEARKLALALALGLHAWALVLDEPTNHLDLPTIERLESALRAFPGCVVVVTHDDAFATAVTDRAVDVTRFGVSSDVGV